MNIAEQVLELARWAPSGDNTQPWRFEIIAEDRVVIHAFDTRSHCVYDLEGHASQLSVGALLETLRIAASVHGRCARVARRPGTAEELPLFDVWLEPAASQQAHDPLHAAIRRRSVQRKPLRTQRLSADAKAALESALPAGFRAIWFESLPERFKMTLLAVHSAKIRLLIPEAYAVHREIIQWNSRYSERRVPDQALGAGLVTIRLLRWALSSWNRVQFMNQNLGGTIAPRFELELLPGLLCGAHFAILASNPRTDIDARVAAGAAVQRFWLTAASQGLQLQPQHAPLVFARYARKGLRFTNNVEAAERAAGVAHMPDRLLGTVPAAATVFLGRVGCGAPASARSLRLSFEQLLWTGQRVLDTRTG